MAKIKENQDIIRIEKIVNSWSYNQKIRNEIWRKIYKELNRKFKKTRQVGIISQNVITTLGLNLGRNSPILISESNYKHILDKHPDEFIRFSPYIKDIIEMPDYVGINSKDNSIEYIKEFEIENEFVKAAVRVSGKGKHFVRSMYTINKSRVKNSLATGQLKKLIN